MKKEKNSQRGGKEMTIAEISNYTGISCDTLRYYERMSLIPSIKRLEGGKRFYTEADCKWICQIKNLRNAGMSIETLIHFTNLYKKGDETIEDRKEILKRLIDQINDNIIEVEKIINQYEQCNEDN